MSWHAEFADGESAVMQPVLVRLEAGELIILSLASGEALARWPLAETSLDELQDGGIAHAQCRASPLAQLTVGDPALAAELRGRVGRGLRLPGGGNRLRFAVVAAAAVAAVAAGIYLSIPALARAIAQRVPLAYERELGAQLLPLISEQYCAGAGADAALTELKRRLDPRDEVPAELHVWRSDRVNAFALPGGVVVLSEGLLARADGPDEVAGVLAHELEHVRQRHVMGHFVRATLLAAGWSVAVGDYAGLMVLDPTTAFHLVNLRFSREEEAAADAGAALALDRARVSRRGLYDFFQRLRAETDVVPDWLSNHPSSESRARLIGDGANGPAGATPALAPEAFEALKSACRER